MRTGFNVGNFCGSNPLEIRSDNSGGRCGESGGRGDIVGGRRGGNWVGPIRRRPINSNKKPKY